MAAIIPSEGEVFVCKREKSLHIPKRVLLSSSLVLSPQSPVVDGLCQSLLNFKVPVTPPNQAAFSAQPLATKEAICRALFKPAETVTKVEATASDSTKENKAPPGSRNIKASSKQTRLDEACNVIAEDIGEPAPLIKASKISRRRRRNTVRRSSSVNQPELLTADVVASVRSRKKNASLTPKKPIQSRAVQIPPRQMQQTHLTDLGIRRTARQFAKDMERQRQADVLTALVNSEDTGMKVVMTDDKGRGVISTRHFAAGEFIVEYAGELISEIEARRRESEYKKHPELGSFMFFFTHGSQRYCVDATKETTRLGRLINHSRQHPTCTVKAIPVGGVPRLALFARQPIPLGEELLYDYGDRDKESLASHPWLKY